MQVTLPYSERRQVDMARGVIASASTVGVGDEPNYGTGCLYWRSAPPARAMQDTSGVPGSLPLTSLALDTALLDWGLTGSALDKIGFYFSTFVHHNGSLDMGHWKDIWADGGDGEYNCSFPDSLADHGRMAGLFAQAVRVSRNTTWMQQHLPAVLRMGQFMLQMRQQAQQAIPRPSIYHGIVFGPGEHDTCDTPRVLAPMQGSRGDFFFSVNLWTWRGLLELGNLLRDFPSAGAPVALSQQLLAEAALFQADISRALEASLSLDAAGKVFVPPIVGPNQTAFPSMTYNVASYSNVSAKSCIGRGCSIDFNGAVLALSVVLSLATAWLSMPAPHTLLCVVLKHN